MTMMTSRPHDEAVVEMLKADPAFANEYLAVARIKPINPAGNRLCWRLCGTLLRRKACLRWPRERACPAKACTGHSVHAATPHSKPGWLC